MMIDYLEYPSCCCFSLWVCALCNVIIRCQFYFIFSAIIGYLTMCSTETISFHYCSPLAVTTFLDLDFWIWMKSSIVAEPFSVKMNMLKAAGEVGTNWMTYVVILWQGMIRYLRTVVRVGYWRFTKVKRIHWHTTHVMKLVEQAMRMKESLKRVKIDNIQFGLMAGRGTTDTVRQWQKKYLAKKKDLWVDCVDIWI